MEGGDHKSVKSVVFCGAKPGKNPLFGEKAAGKVAMSC